MEELILGSVGVSIILTIILRMIYGILNVANKLKPLIAVGIGLLLAIVVLFYNLEPGKALTFRMLIDYLVQGFMTGATAVGLYELSKKRA